MHEFWNEERRYVLLIHTIGVPTQLVSLASKDSLKRDFLSLRIWPKFPNPPHAIGKSASSAVFA